MYSIVFNDYNMLVYSEYVFLKALMTCLLDYDRVVDYSRFLFLKPFSPRTQLISYSIALRNARKTLGKRQEKKETARSLHVCILMFLVRSRDMGSYLSLLYEV